jgi:hypothetical protein
MEWLNEQREAIAPEKSWTHLNQDGCCFGFVLMVST